MDLVLAGKTAIVTGGGSNIGRAISLTLGAEGANVVIAELDAAQGNKVAREIEQKGGRATCVVTDVTDPVAVQNTVKTALDRFGQVHVLVNNVGWEKPQLFLETDQAFWEKVIELNVRCHLHVLKTVLPHMVERGYGRIVSIGSEAARVGEYRDSIYAGCKAGLIALSKAIAREVGRHNITLNVVCPAITPPTSSDDIGATSMWATVATGEYAPGDFEKMAKKYALRRLGTAQDIANAVTFLASDAANFVTGQTLSVNGGFAMW